MASIPAFRHCILTGIIPAVIFMPTLFFIETSPVARTLPRVLLLLIWR